MTFVPPKNKEKEEMKKRISELEGKVSDYERKNEVSQRAINDLKSKVSDNRRQSYIETDNKVNEERYRGRKLPRYLYILAPTVIGSVLFYIYPGGVQETLIGGTCGFVLGGLFYLVDKRWSKD